ncbi:MAG: hypothetical protein ABR981_05995 [Candidatus Micrarchaeaceae archaeon]|jgi:hypothetical protein
MQWVADIVQKRRIAKQIKDKALEALEKSDLSEVLELAGTMERNEEASAAMKAILAEKITEYTIKAMGEAKKRGTKVGAAAIIIAASRAK